MNDIKRGEMFYISRGGASYNGSEQHSDRPAVVVSNNTRPCMNSCITQGRCRGSR